MEYKTISEAEVLTLARDGLLHAWLQSFRKLDFYKAGSRGAATMQANLQKLRAQMDEIENRLAQLGAA